MPSTASSPAIDSLCMEIQDPYQLRSPSAQEECVGARVQMPSTASSPAADSLCAHMQL